MTTEEIREKILTDDAFVIAEVRKLQYLSGLKQVIRAKQTRTEDIQTESVAEHIYSLGILARYFLPLEDPEQALDQTKIHLLIQWHELDEIEQGDIVPWEKTEAIKNALRADTQRALEKMPDLLRAEASTYFTMYEEKENPEACFVKAIDKIDPVIDSYTPAGKQRMQNYEITAAQNLAIKRPHIDAYPYISRFNQVIHERFLAEGFFSS